MICLVKYKLSNLQSNIPLKIIVTVIFIVGIFQSASLAQTTAATASPPASISPSPTLTPIPFSDIIAQSDQANSTLEEIASNTSANPTADAVERDLPALTEEINAWLDETAQIIESRTSLERLRNFETSARALAKNLPQWRNDLTDRARKLEASLTQISELEKKWRTTESEQMNLETPEVTTRIQNVLTIIADTRRQIEAQQARVVSLQDRVAEQQKRIDGAVGSLRQTREALVGQLLVQDNPPVWSRGLWSSSEADIRREMGDTLTAQITALNDFVNRNAVRIVVHLLVFLIFAGLLLFLRRKAHPSVEKDATLKNAAVIFYLPISTALVLAIMFSSRIYPQTPQILGAIFGAIALVPTVIILRKLVARSLAPILYSLVVFYFIDLLRAITESQEIVSRSKKTFTRAWRSNADCRMRFQRCSITRFCSSDFSSPSPPPDLI